MISIGESISELEKIYKLHSASLECYHAALQSMAQYAVEVDDAITAPHRRHLTALAGGLCEEVTVQMLAENRATLRSELRDYRDKASVFLNGLRQEMSRQAETLQAIVESMASCDDDHEARFEEALLKLREVSARPAAAPVRAALVAVSDQIEAGIEDMKKQNQLTVTQFLVEIRTLHTRIETLRAASAKDVLTNLPGRSEIETRISSEMETGKPFCVVLVKIRNLPMVEKQFGAQIRDEAVAAFVKRLCNGIPADAPIGRWSPEQFVALTGMNQAEALDLAKRITPRISGTYACMENGTVQKPSIEVSVAVIESSIATSGQGLMDRIDHYL